jgi:hypothetical protein
MKTMPVNFSNSILYIAKFLPVSRKDGNQVYNIQKKPSRLIGKKLLLKDKIHRKN